ATPPPPAPRVRGALGRAARHKCLLRCARGWWAARFSYISLAFPVPCGLAQSVRSVCFVSLEPPDLRTPCEIDDVADHHDSLCEIRGRDRAAPTPPGNQRGRHGHIEQCAR